MSAPSPLGLAMRRFAQHRLAIASGVVLAILVVATLAAPLVAWLLGVDPEGVDLFNRFAPPSLAHPLGTDELGRDVLVRLLYGGRVSLAVGVAAAVAAGAIGTLVGLVAGYHGGRLDALLMRLTDGVIALPFLPLLIVLAAIDLRQLGLPESVATSEYAGLVRIVVIVSLVGWTTVARLVRGTALVLRQQPFVEAARAQGAGAGRLMWVHILPNLGSPVIVATTLAAGNMILLETVLSFLGLGIQPPTPSWGNLLTNAQELIWSAPALAFYPGALIFLTVIALNFLGDGLRDALDPRTIRR
ncbi:MAG: ABC transporter permease [Rhodospirillales bacterium]|nr:MAG: ABC transporter permease [Rhodospirillales bacterium]